MLGRLKTEWRLKLALFVVVNAVFWTCYLVLSRHAFFPEHTVPVTVIDRAVGFQPAGWDWVYLSQYLFTGTLPLLLTSRADIRRYAVSLAMMCPASFAIFLLFPTRGPRPADVGGTFPMEWIANADGPLNALPSLHAAFIVCMAALAWRMFGGAAPRTVVLISIVWGGAILFSTLATKQHYALDLLAGGALGWLADTVAWRGARAAAMMPVRIGAASQGGSR